MIITNRYNLPQAIVKAVEADDYSRGDADISMTQLVDPPRKVALMETYKDGLTEDAADRIWVLLGKTTHQILAQAMVNEPTNLHHIEERFYVDCSGWRITGKADSCTLEREDDRWVITDWKVTSVWALSDGVKVEWEQQLNLYALLVGQTLTVGSLRIGAILRDWSKREAERNPDYPQIPFQMLDVPLWPNLKAWDYLRERVELHRTARQELPECTPEERWERPEAFAVHRQGRERAIRVFPTQTLAAEYIKGQNFPQSYTVQHRAGESVRCQSYCAALSFCKQGLALTKGKDNARIQA